MSDMFQKNIKLMDTKNLFDIIKNKNTDLLPLLQKLDATNKIVENEHMNLLENEEILLNLQQLYEDMYIKQNKNTKLIENNKNLVLKISEKVSKL